MSGKIIFGFIIFFVGLGLLLDRVGVINFSSFIQTWWPLVFILMGFSNLFSQTKSKLSGIIFLILGFSFLAVTTSTIDRNILTFIWPIILIIVGLWLMLPFNRKFSANSPNQKINTDSQLEISTIFSSQNIKLDSKDLIGGEISTVFSSLKLDLRDCVLVADGASIELNSVFSNVQLIVPESWYVKVQTNSILGSIVNKLSSKQQSFKNLDNHDSIPTLTIKGATIFGTIELTN